MCQTLGEALSWLLALPIPGPVVGVALLFVGAGVGVVAYADRIAAQWLPIGATVVASTVLAIGVAALVVRWASGRFGGGAP